MNRRHLAAVLLVPALALTACGGDGDGAEPTAAPLPTGSPPIAPPTGGGSSTGGSGETPATPSAVPSKVVNAFVACMREQGVKVPDDVGTWKPDPKDGRTQKALMACIGRSGAPPS